MSVKNTFKNIQEYVANSVIQYLEEDKVIKMDGEFHFMIERFDHRFMDEYIDDETLLWASWDFTKKKKNKKHKVKLAKGKEQFGKQFQEALEKKFGTEPLPSGEPPLTYSKYLSNVHVRKFHKAMNVGEAMCHVMLLVHPNFEMFDIFINDQKYKVLYVCYLK